MLNAKLLIGSSAGAAGVWKFWPEQASWHPIFFGIVILMGLWVCLVVLICALDYRRRRSPARMHRTPQGHSRPAFPPLDDDVGNAVGR